MECWPLCVECTSWKCHKMKDSKLSYKMVSIGWGRRAGMWFGMAINLIPIREGMLSEFF
jgi:hypothetical protein